MRKLLFLLMILACAYSYAETVEEAINKHPSATCFFFKTPALQSDVSDFEIERVAISKGQGYIKLKNRAKEIVKSIENVTSDPDGTYEILFVFTDGSLFAMDKECRGFYVSTKGKLAVFAPDLIKSNVYYDLKER